jgi:hypothetical protein
MAALYPATGFLNGQFSIFLERWFYIGGGGDGYDGGEPKTRQQKGEETHFTLSSTFQLYLKLTWLWVPFAPILSNS